MPIAVRTLSLAVPALAALVGVVAVVNPPLAIIASLAIVFSALMLADVAVGICLFAFATALFEGIPEFGAFSVAKAVGLILALAWISTLTAKQNLKGELFTEAPAYTVLLIVFATWCGASSLWADDASAAQSTFLRLALNLLMIPIAFAAINDERTLRWLILALMAGMLCSVAYGLSFSTGVEGSEGRLSGSGLDANALALWLITSMILAFGIVAGRGDPGLRAGTFLMVGLGLLAALATASRTGLVALAAALVAAPFLAGRGRRSLALILAVFAVGGATMYLTTFATDTVREHVSSESDGGSGRTDIWKVGERMFKANPVAGVGLGNFQSQSIHYLLLPGEVQRTEHIVDKPKVAHNTYLQIFAETGVVGGVLFVGLYIASFLMALKAAKRFNLAKLRDSEMLSRAIALALIAVAAGAFFISLDATKPLWLLIALGPTALKLAKMRTAPA